MSAVSPLALAWFGSAERCSSCRTSSKLPVEAAFMIAVWEGGGGDGDGDGDGDAEGDADGDGGGDEASTIRAWSCSRTV